MSASPDSFSLRSTVNVTFGEDFLSAEGVEGSVDTAELGLLLSTLVRSCQSCGESLEAGALQNLFAWEAGRALSLTSAPGGYDYQAWEGVTGWEDFDDVPWREVLASDSLLDVRRPEVLDRLCELPGVSWAGIRDFESSQWEECCCTTSLESMQLLQASRLVLQLDTLLKGHGCPRGRLRLSYERASLWAWSNTTDDYLMTLTDRDLPLVSRGALLRIGEAFMLF
jgi:hypothetical protein